MADLHSSCGFGGALANMEEPRAARFAVAKLTGRPTQVDDQRLVLKQAHEMWGLLALSDPDLQKQQHSSTCMLKIVIPADI